MSGPVFISMILFLGLNLVPRDKLCPLGRMFTPSFNPRGPRGEHTLLFRRMGGAN
jgi:hypothetical protein